MNTTRQEYTKKHATNKFYTRQTGRSFTTRYIKQIKAINHPYIKSNFAAEHILILGHKYTNIQTNLQILDRRHKDPKLNTLEQFEIYKHHKTHIMWF